ncbi:DUF2188 domain-containing protein [Microbacterium sp. 22242]|uniref:DUF2188 domain-containing protein n=1 Tax=Microbacterium sp. 22242 TaxID=3453896 RepID=UPI003F83E696
MAAARVVTRSKNGQWVNEVDGARELSRSYSSRDEAVEEGQALAASRGLEHELIESEPTGTIVDGGAPADDVAVVGEQPASEEPPGTPERNGPPRE